MRPLVPLLLSLVLISGSAQGGHRLHPRHFFGPPRTLFFFQPSLYLQSRAHSRAVVISPAFHSSPHHLGVGYTHSHLPQAPRVYPVLLNSRVRGEVVEANTGGMILQVTPSRALVYVDGRLIGSGRDFAAERDRYPLMSGSHQLRIELPGFTPFQSEMEVVPNRTLHLEIELQPEN